MSSAGVILLVASIPAAVSTGPDLLGIAALITAVTGLLAVIVGWARSSRDKPAPAGSAGEVAQVIRVVEDLNACEAERDQLRGDVDRLRAEILRLHDQLGPGRRT